MEPDAHKLVFFETCPFETRGGCFCFADGAGVRHGLPFLVAFFGVSFGFLLGFSFLLGSGGARCQHCFYSGRCVFKVADMDIRTTAVVVAAADTLSAAAPFSARLWQRVRLVGFAGVLVFGDRLFSFPRHGCVLEKVCLPTFLSFEFGTGRPRRYDVDVG